MPPVNICFTVFKKLFAVNYPNYSCFYYNRPNTDRQLKTFFLKCGKTGNFAANLRQKKTDSQIDYLSLNMTLV